MQEKIKIKGATSMTEAQQKFKEKIKKDLNYEVDFAVAGLKRMERVRLPLMQYLRIAKESAEL